MRGRSAFRSLKLISGHGISAARCWNSVSTMRALDAKAITAASRRFYFHSSVSFKQASDNETRVVVGRDELATTLPRHAINWEVFKRSWKYILGDVKNRFAKRRVQEQSRRFLKDDHIVYYFRDPGDLKYWYISTDEEGGGYSWAELRQSPNEMTAMFRGYISERRPRDMLLTDDPLHEAAAYHGFVYLETKPFETVLDKDELMSLIGFNVVKLRIRGDGRRYMFEMMCDLGMKQRVMFTAPIHTNGGPLWQEVSIPYSKFISSHKSSLNTSQQPIDYNRMRNFRFLLSDGIEGPFQLEIDYIALTHDKTFFNDRNDHYDPWRPINMRSGA